MQGGEILAVGGGGFGNILGSRKRGTLLLEATRRGLMVGLTKRDTATARAVAEAATVAPIYARPILDMDESEWEDQGRTRVFTKAAVRAILVKPTDADKGHIPATIEGVAAEPRRRLWL